MKTMKILSGVAKASSDALNILNIGDSATDHSG